MTTLTLAQCNDIAGQLEGQCIHGLEEVCASIGVDYDKIDLDDHVEIDSRVFLCPTCNWWCNIDEAAGAEYSELICDECTGEEDE